MLRFVMVLFLGFVLSACGIVSSDDGGPEPLSEDVREWCSQLETFYRISYEYRDRPMPPSVSEEFSHVSRLSTPAPAEIVRIFPESGWPPSVATSPEEVEKLVEHLRNVVRFCGFPEDLVAYVDSLSGKG